MEKAKPEKTASGGEISNIYVLLLTAFLGAFSYIFDDWGIFCCWVGAYFGARLSGAVKYKRQWMRGKVMTVSSLALGLLFLAVAEYLGI